MFDENTLSTLLAELSTTRDFIDYLNSRANLMQEGKFVFAGSELDVLVYYLWNGRKFPPLEGPYQLESDLWAKLEKSPEFLAGREENKISHFWDGLIEHVSDHYLEETLEFGNEMEMSDYVVSSGQWPGRHAFSGASFPSASLIGRKSRETVPLPACCLRSKAT